MNLCETEASLFTAQARRTERARAAPWDWGVRGARTGTPGVAAHAEGAWPTGWPQDPRVRLRQARISAAGSVWRLEVGRRRGGPVLKSPVPAHLISLFPFQVAVGSCPRKYAPLPGVPQRIF